MNLKKWIYLFGTTLLIGAIASLLTGLFIQLTDDNLKVWDLPLIIFNFGMGLMFSVLSQMGFFAYLTVNYIAKGIISRKLLWSVTQWIIIVIVFFDLIYLRFTNFEENNQGVLGYSILPIALLCISAFFAVIKSQLTNNTAFTPTVFFLFAVTTLEIVPALRENAADTTMIMLIPIFCCNVWQILKLHSLTQKDKKEPTL